MNNQERYTWEYIVYTTKLLRVLFEALLDEA